MPLEGRVQAGAPVQLRVRAAERVPAIGGGAEMAHDALTGDVVVEPAAQPGPGPSQRLMGDLERVLLCRDESGTNQQPDDTFTTRVAQQAAAGHPAADRITLEGRGDEAEQDGAQRRPLLRREAVVEPIGRAGDGAPDAAAAAVALDRQGAALAPTPGLHERMRQQRKTAGFSIAVAHQQLDQAVLQAQPGDLRRLLDRLPQRGSCQRADEMETVLDEPAEVGMTAELAETVTADGDDHDTTAIDMGDE